MDINGAQARNLKVEKSLFCGFPEPSILNQSYPAIPSRFCMAGKQTTQQTCACPTWGTSSSSTKSSGGGIGAVNPRALPMLAPLVCITM